MRRGCIPGSAGTRQIHFVRHDFKLRQQGFWGVFGLRYRSVRRLLRTFCLFWWLPYFHHISLFHFHIEMNARRLVPKRIDGGPRQVDLDL